MTTPNLGMELPSDGDTNWGDAVRGALMTLDGEALPSQQLIDILNERTGPLGQSHLVTGSKNRWRREFNSIDPTEWDVTTSGGATAATPTEGILEMKTGLASGSEVSLVSTKVFTAPVRIAVSAGLSSKVAGQEAYIEFVAVDPDTGALDNDTFAAWRLSAVDSATTTVGAILTCNKGGPVSKLNTTLTNTPFVHSTTVPTIFEMKIESDEAWFYTRLPDSTVSRSYSFVRQTVAPDPTFAYKVRLRFRTTAAIGATATFRVGHIATSDYTEIITEISGSQGNITSGESLPVYVISTPTTTVRIADILLVESKTNLAAGATFTGGSRLQASSSSSTTIYYSGFRAAVFSDQPGTLYMEYNDATATPWRVREAFAVEAGVARCVEVRTYSRYARARFVNEGAATTTDFELQTMQVGTM